jgi:hypothetical protein
MWLWGHNLFKISSPGPVFYGTKCLLWRPLKQSPTFHSKCRIEKGKGKGKVIPVTGGWSPIGLRHWGSHIFYRQSAHRWQWGCQPYALATLYTPGKFLVLMSVRGRVDPRAILWLEGLGKLKKKIHLIGARTRDLPVCSIVPQPTTLPGDLK